MASASEELNPSNQKSLVYTSQSWRDNRELVKYIQMKPDATEDEKLLAYRLEQRL